MNLKIYIYYIIKYLILSDFYEFLFYITKIKLKNILNLSETFSCI